MKRLLIYAGLAMAVFSFTYCTGNSSSENAGDTTIMTTDGTNNIISTDTTLSTETGTFDTSTGMSIDTSEISTGHTVTGF